MKRPILIALAFAVSGCGTAFGYKMGDMTYVHKPRCPNPAKEWIEEDIVGIPAPGKKRMGGTMFRGGYQRVAGHFHYHCPPKVRRG